MADCDDGYTRTANAIQDMLCKVRLSGSQFQVLNAIVRSTYGYNKKSDKVHSGYLADLTGLHRNRVIDAVKVLSEMQIIHVERLGMFFTVEINKVVSEWHLEPDNTARKSVKCARKNGHPALKTVHHCPEKRAQPKTTTKDKEQKISSSEIADAIPDTPGSGVDPSLVLKPDAAVQTPNGKHWGTQGDLTCAEYIFAKVLLVNPTAKTPNWPKWANDIRLLREQDKRSHREICELFKWANADSFWRVNVLSPATLRDKWDSLQAKRINAGVIQQSNATFDLAEHMTTDRLNAMLLEGF